MQYSEAAEEAIAHADTSGSIRSVPTSPLPSSPTPHDYTGGLQRNPSLSVLLQQNLVALDRVRHCDENSMMIHTHTPSISDLMDFEISPEDLQPSRGYASDEAETAASNRNISR